MYSNSNSCESSRAGKRRGGDGDTSTANADRLSHLPDFIIYHILSFLDTKSAVQTCVLSRSWKCVWKHVPVINLFSETFRKYSSFRRFADKVLSLCYPVVVNKINYIDDRDLEVRGKDCLFMKVVNYAISHGRHLNIETDDEVGSEAKDEFWDRFDLILNCNLETLRISGFSFDSQFRGSGFRMLTTLCLGSFIIYPDCDEEEQIDPFSKFPCLKNLAVNRCESFKRGRTCFKVSGLQLLTLKLVLRDVSKIEIFAPKLKSFTLWDCDQPLEFSELTLPSLEHADIWIGDTCYFMDAHKNWAPKHLISLLHGLRNAESLTLCSGTMEVLSKNSEVLEQLPSSFSRLKYLNVESSSIAFNVVTYFLDGSSSTEPKIEFST